VKPAGGGPAAFSAADSRPTFASARRGASGDGARSGDGGDRDGGDRAAAATDTSRAVPLGVAPSPSRADGTRKGFGGDRFGVSTLPLEGLEGVGVEAARGDAPGARYAAARGGGARGGARARVFLAPMPQHPPAGIGGDGG
jgi:hypothetical protein